MVATHNAHHLPTHVGASVTGHTEQVYLETYVHRSAGDGVLVAKSLGELERALERKLNGEEVVIETKLIEAKPPQAEPVAAVTRSKRRPLPPLMPGDGGNHDRVIVCNSSATGTPNPLSYRRIEMTSSSA